jgi:hypothetical protein
VFSLTQIIDSDSDKELHLHIISNIISIRLLFGALDNLSISHYDHLEDKQREIQTQEIFYIPRKEFDNFKLISEKEASMVNVKSLLCMKLFSNKKIEINNAYQNLYNTKIKNSQLKSIEFFGLPLRLNNIFLNMSYNVILHISGGGLSSKLFENEIEYLKT